MNSKLKIPQANHIESKELITTHEDKYALNSDDVKL